MTDSYLVDSNILLRISRRDDPDYRSVEGALERLLREDTELYYTHQNIAEFWNVWTRPADKNGFGLTGETAEREIAKFEGMMTFADDSATVYGRWRQLIRDYGVRGVQVHDARLVATMLVHDIPNLLTLNVADFERYAGVIKAVHPRSFVEAEGWSSRLDCESDDHADGGDRRRQFVRD
jgi:predicted nucleic acid-binding protein